MDEIRILIAGGGTGGHLFPAIAIGENIQSSNRNVQIHYVGSKFGIESKVLPVKSVSHTLLPIKGLQRNLSLTSLIKNISIPYYYFKSISIAKNIFSEFLPDVVVGTGGYASAIPVKISIKKNIPVLLQEQNSYPGLTTRMYASKSNLVCTAFKEAHQYLKGNCHLTGNPIRPDILDGNYEIGMDYFKFNQSLKTIFIFGGSQGSIVLNQFIESIITDLEKMNIQILWQTGDRHFKDYKQYNSELVRVIPFIDSMANAYSVSDLIISRSGALAVSEIMTIGKASILIPLPSAAQNHQYKNARALSDNGAAIIIDEKDLEPKSGYKKIITLLNDKPLLKKMSKKAKEMRKLNATEKICQHIMDLAIA